MSEKISDQSIYSQEEIKEIPRKLLDLEEPIRKILKDILPNIEKGDYQLIIGDDASGRIPTLIFDKFIKAVYKEKGFNASQTIFFAGSSFLWSRGGEPMEKMLDDMQNYVENINRERGQRIKNALIVTDSIISGSSISPIIEALKAADITPDLVVIGVQPPERGNYIDAQDRNRRIGVINDPSIRKYSVGMDRFPKVLGDHETSGVYKNEKDLFSTRYKDYDGIGEEYGNEIQDKTNKARGGVSIISDNLIDWYESRTK